MVFWCSSNGVLAVVFSGALLMVFWPGTSRGLLMFFSWSSGGLLMVFWHSRALLVVFWCSILMVFWAVVFCSGLLMVFWHSRALLVVFWCSTNGVLAGGLLVVF